MSRLNPPDPLAPFETVPVHTDTKNVASRPSASPEAPTVLIIDDDDAIRALAQWVIQRAGYQTLTARDGPEGLASFQRCRDRIRLVLLDLTMPRMTGAEVVAGLRSLGAKVPVVLITGYGAEAVRDEERIGTAGVLQKPFTPDDLRRLLDHYLKTVGNGPN